MKKRVLSVPRRRAGTLALGLAASTLAWAQPATPTLPETVVTATRIDSRVDDLVSEVHVIDRAVLESSTARTLPELLAREAGVQFSSSGGLGQPASVFIRGSESRHTILLIDGVRYGSATLGTPIWETLPVEAIERIEVVKGPASALYGADGAGGVVQVFTRKGQPGERPHASLSVGSYGHVRAGAGIVGSEGALHYTLGLQRTVEGGFSSANPRAPYSNYNGDRDPFQQGSVNFAARYQINPGWRAEGSFLYSDGRVHFDAGTPGNARSALRGELAQVGLVGRVSPGWQTELRLGRTRDTNDTPEPSSYGRYVTQQTQFTWQNTVSTRMGKALVGVEHRDQQVESTTDYDIKKRTIQAAFAGLNGEANGHSWQVNGRHDRNSQFGSADTAFAGYGYRLSSAWRVHGSYGTSFVVPSFNDLYFPIYGNPGLRPERGRNRDIGVSWTGGSHTLKLVSFDNRIRGYISSTTSPQNIPRARIDGWTLSYEGRIDRLTLRASLQDMAPRDAMSGKQLPRRSDTQTTLGVDWRQGDWRLGASVLHVGARFDDSDNTLPLAAYTVTDLHVTWQLKPDLSLQAKLNNLTDRVYETAYGYNQPGRSLYLTLRWQPK